MSNDEGRKASEEELLDDETEEGLIEETFVASEEEVAFLPEADDAEVAELTAVDAAAFPEVDLEGTELDSFEAAEIEEKEFIEDERLESIIESILFASDRPVGLGSLKMVFKGTNIKTENIRRTLDRLAVEYAGARRGVSLEEVPGGWQIRTKVDNLEFLRKTLKSRSFRLSGPALEVLSIVAYKQPMIKHEIDEIRGVESGHLLRALMEKGLVNFGGKSDLPGRPMQYETTRRFLEIFGLRNLKELPTLSQIDELLPEGIGEEDEKEKQTLSQVTDALSENSALSSYSIGEDELTKIQDQLEQISTSSDFFEGEKRRQKEQRDTERAQGIRDAMIMGEEASNRDINWLKKFDEALAQGTTLVRLDEEARAARFATIKAQPKEESSDMEASSQEAEEASLFEEDAPHPEDELGEAADIDGDEDEDDDRGHDEGEGHAAP